MLKLKNFGSTRLASGIAYDASSFTVTTGEGSTRLSDRNFPAVIYPNDYSSALAAFNAGKLEMVFVGSRSGDVCSGVLRGQQGTTALNHNESDKVYVVQQVESALSFQGLPVKFPVRAATTANIALSGEQTIDGVSVVAGDRVLVRAQTTGSANGIYEAASGAWSRAEDFDADKKVQGGVIVVVSEGTLYGNSVWILTTNDTITIGTTTLTFTQIDKTYLGLGSVDNTADLDKPISTDVQAALDNKANAGDVKTYVDIPIHCTIPDSIGAGVTRYAGLGFSGLVSAEASAVYNPIGITGTLIGMIIQAKTNSLSGNYTITFQKGAADASSLTPSTVEVTLATTVKNGSVGAQAIAVTPTEIGGFKIVTAGGSGALTLAGITLIIRCPLA